MFLSGNSSNNVRLFLNITGSQTALPFVSLFILCLEMISIEIIQNKGKKGHKIFDKEIKQTLFADDASFMTDG